MFVQLHLYQKDRQLKLDHLLHFVFVTILCVWFRLFIDDIPIREFPSAIHVTRNYFVKPMSIYATIWDGSDWATNGGKDNINYAYAPFKADYSNFILSGCKVPSTTIDTQPNCDREFTLLPTKLTHHQHKSIAWVQHNLMTYNYCDDDQRYPHRLPDCPRSSIEEIMEI